MSSKNYQN